ncbi:prostate-associated microseminoprotein isoform X1 [Gallus gallus]|uniref:Prostate-associated microseminoprotein n=1 Tax=Gallus gallus TaxID=9031 RepID=A0A8V0Y4P0_CHICK|nr:prostate-associated microseminoprotein isoform X1 [Gallus gallus]XP_046792263.1 prostate-associated microseminoprotein isoform X1 [Gallus gallus]
MDESTFLYVYLGFPNLPRWQEERPPTISHVTGKRGSSDIPVSSEGRGMPVGLPCTLTLIATIFFAAPCEYEGKQFSLGESWLSTNCLLCTCLHPIGVGCCETTQHPIDFPDWCEAHYDTQTCQISVVQKANPSLPCVKSMEHEWGSAGTPEPLNKVLDAGLSR